MKCSSTFLIVNDSKLVRTDPPILRLPGPLVPHLRAIPQKSQIAQITFFPQMSYFSPATHFGRKLLLLICCPAAAHCLRGGSRARLPQHKSKLNWRTEIEKLASKYATTKYCAKTHFTKAQRRFIDANIKYYCKHKQPMTNDLSQSLLYKLMQVIIGGVLPSWYFIIYEILFGNNQRLVGRSNLSALFCRMLLI